jgi:TatD DNase family protein
MNRYIDAHCHLDQFEDQAVVLTRAVRTTTIAVTELPSHYRLLEAKYRSAKNVRVALGLHPLRAETAGPLEEGLFIRLLDQANFIGETGLDGSSHGRPTMKAQLRIFDRLLAHPNIRHKVVSVHSRGAERTVIDRLTTNSVPAVLHWYTGPNTLIDHALSARLRFSINPSMLRTTKGQALIAAIPHDCVLTESDGPHGRIGQRPASPADMGWLVERLATIWDRHPTEVTERLYQNFVELFASTVGTKLTEPAATTCPSSPEANPDGEGEVAGKLF